jgi:trk system potassium uptake protein TrkH
VRAEPGQDDAVLGRFQRARPARRLALAVRALVPVYAGLTLVLWIALMAAGERSFVALIHAMSTLATSGISPIGGFQNSAAGPVGEGVVFMFFIFALSRLTFSSDTVPTARPGLVNDPEFRLGVLIVAVVPLILFLRHWIGAIDIEAGATSGGRSSRCCPSFRRPASRVPTGRRRGPGRVWARRASFSSGW